MIECPSLNVTPEQVKQYMTEEQIRRHEAAIRGPITGSQGYVGYYSCAKCPKFIMYIQDGVLCGFPTLQKPRYIESIPI